MEKPDESLPKLEGQLSKESVETATENLHQAWSAQFTKSALFNYINTGNGPRDPSLRPSSQEMETLKESSFEDFLNFLSPFKSWKELRGAIDKFEQEELFEKMGMIPTWVIREVVKEFTWAVLVDDYFSSKKN